MYDDFSSLDELRSIERRLEDKIEKYIGGDRNFHTGDRRYQEILNDLDEIREEIERRELKNNENTMENLMNFDQFSLNEEKKKLKAEGTEEPCNDWKGAEDCDDEEDPDGGFHIKEKPKEKKKNDAEDLWDKLYNFQKPFKLKEG